MRVGILGPLEVHDDGRLAEAASSLAEALGQWRGPALADVADAAFAAAAITRLSELRLAALEDRIDAELALGRGAELVPPSCRSWRPSTRCASGCGASRCARSRRRAGRRTR